MRLKGKFKNLFAKKKPNDYFDKQGFFVFMFLCIGIIGAAFYVVNGGFEAANADPRTKAELTAAGYAKDVARTYEQALVDNTNDDDAAITIGDVTTSPDSTQTIASNDETKPSASPTTKYVAPINGSITLGYSDKTLIYSKTLKQWTTHMGIDISANKGDNVKAIAGGTVEDSYKDNMTGYTVIIDHGNGLKSYYANLASADVVKKGDTVKQGDVIGKVGDSAIFELLDETHLHFEIKLNGKNVDPNNYFVLPVKASATTTPTVSPSVSPTASPKATT